jgi:ATP-dependent DNA helicase RecG
VEISYKLRTNSMMTLSSLVQRALERIRDGETAESLESDVLEFKEDGGNEREAIKAAIEASICFANGRGGEVVIGVSNSKTGIEAFVGVSLDATILQRRVFELTRPGLTVDAADFTFEGAHLVVLRAPQSPEIHSDTQGRAPRRLGKDCLPMSPAEQMLLREERRGIDHSAGSTQRLVTEASPFAIAIARQRLGSLADERRKLSRLSERDLLAALGVVNASGRLLRAGELLFCEPSSDVGPAVVYQYRATPGGEPKAIERIEEPLLVATQKFFDLIQARRNITPVTLPDGQQMQIADFPELAVREAFVNAIVHRDLHLAEPVHVEHSPEVLVFSSPGPLVSGVTPDNILTHPSKPRNPMLAKAVQKLGLAEEVGRGVDRMFREMIRSGRDVPRIESTFDHVRVSLVGGAPNTQIARYIAQLPEGERDDTDTLLILFRLCSARTTSAAELASILQKTPEEAETVLRRLATDSVGVLESTRQTARRAHPLYRLRGETLKALGSAVPYQRRTVDEIDRKVIAHVREYGKVTNRTLQNLFDMSIQRAKSALADMVDRKILKKISAHQRGPGVEYGAGARFPVRGSKSTRPRGARHQLPLEFSGKPTKPRGG